jgi:hypothetical protein
MLLLLCPSMPDALRPPNPSTPEEALRNLFAGARERLSPGYDILTMPGPVGELVTDG